MTIHDEEVDSLGRLDARFRAETTWASGTRETEPTWYQRLLTSLVLVIGDSEIRYLSVNYSLSAIDDLFSTDVIVLTDGIVAYATFDGEQNGEISHVAVTALPRRSLTGFGVSVAEDGSLSISVSYPDFSRELPLGASDWPHHDSEIRDLIDNLRQDLVA